jgi:hypothetical protein
VGRCFGDADTRAQTEEITLQSVGGELGQDGRTHVGPERTRVRSTTG